MPDALTRFIVHGWLGSEDSDIVNHTAVEYRRAEAGNVVKVDWSHTAAWKFYPLSALQTAYIGGVIASLINKLLSLQAISVKNLHLIGHSLGAHVMGNAGSMIEGKPARITGLDPAKPGFEGLMAEKYRLDATDADFVDIIHSAAGAAGYYGSLGHVDFYPNGGTPPQPGCFDMSQPWQLIGCSHARSYYYYIESISDPDGFPAVKCDSWGQFKSGSCENNTKIFMGDATPPTARGIYYLETNSQAPFAKG
ncbi:Lipase [Nesidiocoris tenuis]|uniref:Lipase n=1 Tax=Nesidiocoris tenuis TaxID=355587 RepID=A0ABN7ASE3_9HEMI|nr:Lipase [Nesidiocoris tenuis]